LDEFVREALRAGSSREECARVLTEAGWPRAEVDDALRAYAPVQFAVPVPRPRAQLSARDAFLYLVMFGMLYFGAYHLGKLVFQFVNLAFPDPTSDRRVAYELRWSTSAVIVSFPIFFFAAARIARGIRRDPLQRNSAVRKWLTYLTLAVAAFIVAGDLIYLLNSLLAGELTARFVLKCLTVAVIAGTIFGYYLWSLRHDERTAQP
jgi:hypothetical protein